MGVYFYGCITMDGYLADKNHNLDWLHQTGTVGETGYEDFYQSMDITIMGKRTFCEIEKLGDAGEVYPTTQNYVITHSMELPQKGFTPVDGSVVELVNRLGKDKNIWVVGGNTVLSPLLDHDMVDCMVIQIAPVLLGDGIPLFSRKEMVRRFFLEEVKKYGQFVELVYRRQ